MASADLPLFSPHSSMAHRLAGFYSWLEHDGCWIKDRTGQLVPLRLNAVQERIFARLYEQALAGRPLRVVVLKARKPGVSTFFQSLYYYLARHTPLCSARTIAHTADSTQDIFEISKRLHAHCRPVIGVLGRGQIAFPHDSSVTLRTAGGEHVSSGATVNLLHISELPKWPGAVQEVKAQLASVMQSVPFEPTTCVAIEATANMFDAAGQFREYWERAKHRDSPYAAIFSPWFEEPGNALSGPPIPDDQLSDYERELMARFGVSHAQLRWRRQKIAGDFAGDERFFRQEYPATEDEAWTTPAGLVYPMLNAATHDRHLSLEELRGYQFYRTIDFGATDPFVCLWVAHKPHTDRPALTIDARACPNTWREMTGYSWGNYGRPRDINDHAPDALRYAVMHYQLTGHVHVFREFYEADSPSRNRSILDLARDVLALSREPLAGTVCDRSQPGTITLLNQQGLYAEPARVPDRVSERGEKVDGIMRLQALMVGTAQLVQPPPPPRWEEELLQQAEDWPVSVSLGSLELSVGLSRYEESAAGFCDTIFGGCD